MDKPKNRTNQAAPIVEVLEPRVLFSADSLSVLGSALLPHKTQDQPSLDTLYEGLNLLHPLDSDVSLNENTGVELVFIDSRVPDLQMIVDDITANKNASVKVIVIDQSESGIDRVQQTLAQNESVDAVHIISHSLGSGVRIGADFLTSDNITLYSSQLASWVDSFSENADLLIYGCDIANSENGIALMGHLAALTGADVAASTNDTGHASSNGDWVLEKSTGVIETSISNALQDDWDHILASWDPANNILTIDYTNDRLIASATRYTSVQALVDDAVANSNDTISLREAITAANNDAQDITIKLSGTTYSISIGDGTGAPDEDAAATGDLDVTGNLVIEGNAAGTSKIEALAVEGINEMRVLDVHAGSTWR